VEVKTLIGGNMHFDIFLMKEAEPVQPTHFCRILQEPRPSDPMKGEPANCHVLTIYDQIENPEGIVVGIAKDVDFKSHLTTLSKTWFAVDRYPQVLRVMIDGGKAYYAAIPRVTVHPEAVQDLQSQHNIDAAQVLQEIIFAQVDRWFEQL
jgi:hypothetical protein